MSDGGREDFLSAARVRAHAHREDRNQLKRELCELLQVDDPRLKRSCSKFFWLKQIGSVSLHLINVTSQFFSIFKIFSVFITSGQD